MPWQLQDPVIISAFSVVKFKNVQNNWALRVKPMGDWSRASMAILKPMKPVI